MRKCVEWSQSAPEKDISKLQPMEAQIYVAKPNGKSLTKHRAFTASVHCVINGPKAKDLDVISNIEPGGTLKVINSNVGCKSLKGFKDKSGKTPKNPARATSIVCFAGAIEFHYMPDPDSQLAKELIQRGAPKDKYYMVQLFPSTGEAQVPGCLFADTMHDARWAIEECMKTLEKSGIPPEGEDNKYRIVKPLIPVSLKYNMALVKLHDRVVFDLDGLAKVLEDTPTDELPYPFAGKIMRAVENQELQFKFNIAKKTNPLVKVYGKGSINILSCRKPEEADKIAEFLEKTISSHWMETTGVVPATDSEIQQYPIKKIVNIPAMRRGVSFKDAHEDY